MSVLQWGQRGLTFPKVHRPLQVRGRVNLAIYKKPAMKTHRKPHYLPKFECVKIKGRSQGPRDENQTPWLHDTCVGRKDC
jgi:hypothetical protein